MVSPVEKSGGNVSVVQPVHAAPAGGAVSFFSSASFAGSPASPLGNSYVARRGANWETEAVDPPQFNRSDLLVAPTPAKSRDLTMTLGASQLALTAGAVEGGSNLYLRDNASGSRSLVVGSGGGLLFGAFAGAAGGSFIGGTPSFSRVIFHTSETLPVDAGPPPAPGVENIYAFGDGRLEVVNVLPDGTVDPAGAHIGQPIPRPYQHAISEDGSKAFFQVGGFGAGHLYVRENGTGTKAVSEAQSGPEAGTVQDAEFRGAAADGSVAYLTSTSELLAGAGQNNLYRYDTGSGALTALIPSPPAGGAQVREVLGAASDGSFVYFSSAAALVPEANEAPFLATNFYVWHDGEIELIGETAEANNEFAAPQNWSISPDGDTIALASESPLTSDDVPSPACEEESCTDVYAFEWGAVEPSCLSCDGPARGDSIVGGQSTREPGSGDEFPHAVLDDGTVFFDTPNSLLPRDANGIGDVYAWRAGAHQLISTGTSDQPSSFGDATLDGSDVYFLTGQRLVKQDSDESIDLYDNRELGGLAAQWPPGSPAPCEGEGCRGAAPGPPAGLGAGSSVAAAGACGELRAAAAKARQQAGALAGRARKAAHRRGAAAKARSRHLRGAAKAARKRANRLQTKAANCGRNR